MRKGEGEGAVIRERGVMSNHRFETLSFFDVRIRLRADEPSMKPAVESCDASGVEIIHLFNDPLGASFVPSLADVQLTLVSTCFASDGIRFCPPTELAELID
jgi:hypothetical protein